MSRLSIFMVLVAAAPFAAGEASAQETIKIGAVQSMTGSFNPIGKQVMAGARLYLQEHGYTMAGKKIEILLKDDTNPYPLSQISEYPHPTLRANLPPSKR